ncbi:Transcriptional regulator, LysR family [Granulibacter bethesdensis]|nr:Transcriptional regulator, LysR family [Granulibacter bethesdensis]
MGWDNASEWMFSWNEDLLSEKPAPCRPCKENVILLTVLIQSIPIIMSIVHRNLSRLDLNLLTAFDAIYTERSVTKAAECIGVGQSAMSHNLARLREALQDELFVRTPSGMEPTPRARAIADTVRNLLWTVQDKLLTTRSFTPATAERIWRIGLADNIESLLMPPLLDMMLKEAPGMRIQAIFTDGLRVLEALDRDELDMGIGVFRHGGNVHKRRNFAPDSYLCLYDPKQITLEGPITLDQYASLPHVLVSLRGIFHGVADDALSLLGRTRTIVMTTPHFLSVPYVLRGAPVITTLPGTLARSAASAHGLCVSPLPFELAPFRLSMLWHSSYDNDPAHRWLRNTVAGLMDQMHT